MAKTMFRIFLVFVSMSIVAGSAPAGAEEHRDRAGRARTLLVLRIAEELELSDEKALQISRIFKAGGEKREALRAERRALDSQLETAVSAGDEAAVKTLVSQAREIDRKAQMVALDSFAEIDSVLSVIEQGKLALLVPKIQDQLRRGGRRGREGRRRGERGEGRWGGGPGSRD